MLFVAIVNRLKCYRLMTITYIFIPILVFRFFFLCQVVYIEMSIEYLYRW